MNRERLSYLGIKKETTKGFAIPPDVFISQQDRAKMRNTIIYQWTILKLTMELLFRTIIGNSMKANFIKNKIAYTKKHPEILFFDI